MKPISVILLLITGFATTSSLFGCEGEPKPQPTGTATVEQSQPAGTPQPQPQPEQSKPLVKYGQSSATQRTGTEEKNCATLKNKMDNPRADFYKARADRKKTRAILIKAGAANLQKAQTDYDQAGANLQKAQADYSQAFLEYEKHCG